VENDLHLRGSYESSPPCMRDMIHHVLFWSHVTPHAHFLLCAHAHSRIFFRSLARSLSLFVNFSPLRLRSFYVALERLSLVVCTCVCIRMSVVMSVGPRHVAVPHVAASHDHARVMQPRLLEGINCLCAYVLSRAIGCNYAGTYARTCCCLEYVGALGRIHTTSL